MLSKPDIIKLATETSDIQNQLLRLYTLVYEIKKNDKTIVELGMRYGTSTRAMVAAVNDCGGSIVSLDIRKLVSFPDEPNFSFIEGDDRELIKNWTQQIDLLFIDTSHTYEHTLFELMEWGKWVAPNGIIALHDTNQSGVMNAINEYLKLNDSFYFENFPESNGLGVIKKANKIELCSLVKSNRPKDLKEWVDYHLAIGIDYITIFDNGSVFSVEDLFKDNVKVGVKKIIGNYGYTGGFNQYSLYTNFSNEKIGQCQWLGCIDDDEFIYLKSYTNIKEILDNNIDVLCMMWKMISSQEVLEDRDTTLIDTFKYTSNFSPWDNRIFVKSIVNLKNCKTIKWETPHLPTVNGNRGGQTLEGIKITDDFLYYNGKEDFYNQELSLYHYYHQSYQDRLWKVQRCPDSDKNPGRPLDIKVFVSEIEGKYTKVDQSVLLLKKKLDIQRFYNENLTFVSCLGVDPEKFDLYIIPQFIDHYRSLGINNLKIVINAETIEKAEEGRALLKNLGIDPIIWISPFTDDGRIKLLNSIQEKLTTKWVIAVDGDELLQLTKKEFDDFIIEMESKDYDIAEAVMIDRVGDKETLKKASLWDQYPYETNITETVVKGYTHKIFLFQPNKFSQGLGGHTVINKATRGINQGKKHPTFFKLAHFKWTPTVLNRIKGRYESYKGRPWVTELDRTIDFIEKGGVTL